MWEAEKVQHAFTCYLGCSTKRKSNEMREIKEKANVSKILQHE